MQVQDSYVKERKWEKKEFKTPQCNFFLKIPSLKKKRNWAILIYDFLILHAESLSFKI